MSSKRRAKAPTVREQETRAEIIAAARSLLRQFGPHKMAMEDIAAACGKTKSFLYYYFPGKRELVRAVVEAELNEASQAVRRAVNAEQAAPDKLRTFVRVRLEAIVQQVTSVGLATIDRILRGRAPGWGDFRDLLELRRSIDEQDAKILIDLVQLGISDGTFRAMEPELVQEFAGFVMSALRGIELDLVLDPARSGRGGPRIAKLLDVLITGLER